MNLHWRKPWKYLDEVIAATQTVYEQNSHTIELSEPLRELEQQMNQIKMSILLSQKAVKEAEDRKNELEKNSILPFLRLLRKNYVRY